MKYLVLALFCVSCGLFGGESKVPTKEEMEKLCPEAFKAATVDCAMLAVEKCGDAGSMAECAAADEVRAECDAKWESKLKECK